MNTSEPSARTAPVDASEPITRFVFRKNDVIKKPRLAISATVFIPPADRETSIFKTAGISSDAIWVIGIDHVEAERKKRGDMQSLKARADLFVRDAIAQNLRVVPETSTHARHCNIVDWPVSDSETLDKAQQLALASVPHLRPATPSAANP